MCQAFSAKPGAHRARQVTHGQVTGGPVFNVTVCGDDLEDRDEAIALAVDAGAGCGQVDLGQGTLATNADSPTPFAEHTACPASDRPGSACPIASAPAAYSLATTLLDLVPSAAATVYMHHTPQTRHLRLGLVQLPSNYNLPDSPQ